MIILYKIGDLDGWKHISFAKSWKVRPGPSKNFTKNGWFKRCFSFGHNRCLRASSQWSGAMFFSDHLYSIETLGGSINWYCHASHAEFLWVSLDSTRVFPKIGVPQNGWFGGTTIFGNIRKNTGNPGKLIPQRRPEMKSARNPKEERRANVFQSHYFVVGRAVKLWGWIFFFHTPEKLIQLWKIQHW